MLKHMCTHQRQKSKGKKKYRQQHIHLRSGSFGLRSINTTREPALFSSLLKSKKNVKIFQKYQDVGNVALYQFVNF
jgi:hypothetical protein